MEYKSEDKLDLSDERRVYSVLKQGWKFTRQDSDLYKQKDFDDSAWSEVKVPHDWAIYGPFDKDNDPQRMAIVEDGQSEAQVQLGRTGGLPFVGVGWYRKKFSLSKDIESKKTLLQFDGAMSDAHVYVNGQLACQWPYGYNTFYADITDYVNAGENVIAVRLENLPLSSRWYPGAGLYRNVHLIISEKTRIAHWGTTITTESLDASSASIKIKTQIEAPDKKDNLKLVTQIYDHQNNKVADKTSAAVNGNLEVSQELSIKNPCAWSPDNPYLYSAVSQLYQDGALQDQSTTSFGIRTIGIIPDKGFYLNGEKIIFKGVNLHHDLGALGAAINDAALRRQVRIMKDMGANAIRTSHNMPAPELVKACDSMGMMLMAETFDEWKKPKMENGYNLIFDDWAEKDIKNLVHHFKNSPSIVMWSIGNEIPEQDESNGKQMSKRLQDIFHREDPTRPVTQGLNIVDPALDNGIAAVMDIAGLNYHTYKYKKAYETLPQKILLGSETVSCFSGRGVYKFPVERKSMAIYPDFQASSYDVEHADWSQLPEDNFIYYDCFEHVIGEFVWTGFDYLGEPTPYYSQWPMRSSHFGIVDLAGLPKDRFYLYRSFWNENEDTLHILPHWNWPGREGQKTPVFAYTNYPSAELFINGVSQGVQEKYTFLQPYETENKSALKNLIRQRRYRLMWMDAEYEAGKIEVVAYDKQGKEALRTSVQTAGEIAGINLSADRQTINADGEDLAFITISLEDENGNLNPVDDRQVAIEVTGSGLFKAMDNGDPTSVVPFQSCAMKTFSGKLVAIVQAGYEAGDIEVRATSPGLKPNKIILHAK